ncbi:MAG: hypothetical protein CMQ15_14865 [Gammaproteobacteria bacterium]|nr:hypothetical protein [Gammaproteobacteria bacterium]
MNQLFREHLLKRERQQVHYVAFIHLIREREINQELTEASKRIDTLQGMLPICPGCKKIRDDTGYWEQIGQYIIDHSNAGFFSRPVSGLYD